jgi:hypothetical protein
VAASLREALAEVGIESTPSVERVARPSRDRVSSAEQSDWGHRFGIPEPGISRHAAERYRERFGDEAEDLEAARDRLRARLEFGEVTFSRERPSWLVIVPRVGRQIAENSAGFLLVDEEMALPLRKGTSETHPYYVVTCIPRI